MTSIDKELTSEMSEEAKAALKQISDEYEKSLLKDMKKLSI